MIAKLSTGNGFGGATSYLLRNGESDEERAKVKVLAAVGVDYSVNENGNIVLDSRQVARDFRFQSMMMPSVRKPVYDIALSWKVGEHVPSDEKLARTVEFLQMIGFDNTQYVIVEHEKDNEHSHAIANIVDNDGNRISTKDLIERMHAAAREITKKYGYQWGESAKKETIEKAHKPHEKARYTIEPKVKAAVAKANDIQDLPGLLKPSGIGCNIKYSESGKPVGISFSVEFDGQLHTFRGSDLDRSLSAGNIVKNIGIRLAQEESNRIAAAALQEQAKATELRNAYRQMVPTIQELDRSARNTFQLYADTKATGIAISAQTTQKYNELKRSLSEFRQLNQERREATTTGTLIKSIGGMMMSLNPIVGILAIVIGKIAMDIRLSAIQYEKNALLTKIEGLKSDIDSLQQQKAQIKIEKQERLNNYLQAKDARNEFRAGMNTVKEEIDAIKRQVDQVIEKKPVQTPKPNIEVVKTFTVDYDKFRIKKEADGTYKLQQLKPDTSSPVIDHKYSKNAWFVKAKFTSFSEVKNDANGVYFKIKDFDTGKTRYINQHGNDLSKKQLQRLGLAKSNGMGGRSM